MKIVAANKQFATTFSSLSYKIRPDNQNTNILADFLLQDQGHIGTVSKELTTVGISHHFDYYTLKPASMVKNGPLTSAFEYVIEPKELVQNSIVEQTIFIEVKPFDSKRSTYAGIICEYEKQRSKGISNFRLIIDYSNKSADLEINTKLKERIFEIQKALQKNNWASKIELINSSDMPIPINNDIWDYSKDLVIGRLERNYNYFQNLNSKDQNMLSGKSPISFEDSKRLRNEFSIKHLEINNEVHELLNRKRK